MGEYATYGGDQIKIGTCEDMYYLRFDQRHLVTPQTGNVNPNREDDLACLRFRFPWPTEDTIEPGAFENYDKSLRIYGAEDITGTDDHYSAQFVNNRFGNLSLPCPDGPEWEDGGNGWGRKHTPTGIVAHKNGYNGGVHLVAQKYLTARDEQRLVPILKCGTCGAMWRVEDRSTIEGLAVLIRSEGDRRAKDGGNSGFYHAIADRVLADQPVTA